MDRGPIRRVRAIGAEVHEERRLPAGRLVAGEHIVRKLLRRAQQTLTYVRRVPTRLGVTGVALTAHQSVRSAARQFVFQKNVRHRLMPARNDE